MDFSVVYLAQRLVYRIAGFFKHWYVGGSHVIGRRFMATLASADRSFAVAITVRHFFEPLYKDYTVIGRILGVVFRTGRILIGGMVYLVIVIIYAAIYLVWLAIPAAILFNAVRYL